MWAGRGPTANDLHALEISLTIGPGAKQGLEGGKGIFLDDTGAGLTWAQRSWMMERKDGGGWMDLMSFCL